MIRFVPGKILLSVPLFTRVRPLKRPRSDRSGGHFYQPKQDQIELRNFMKKFNQETIRDKFFLNCHFVFEGKRFPGDIDNLIKAVLDGLQASEVIEDDRNCVGINSTLNFGEENFVIIEIEVANEHDFQDEIQT